MFVCNWPTCRRNTCSTREAYPAALERPENRRRATWYRDYVETLVQRDVRALARINSLDALPRLLALAAGVRFASGVVLYDGETTARFGDQLFAVPIRRLWEAA